MRTALKKDEKILIIIRQHWIKLVLPILIWLLITVLAFIYAKASTAFIIALIAALYPIYTYLAWKYNLWAVTNLRVVDESGFASRYSKESPLDKINNIEYDQTLWGRILGYGDVDIQTAAELGETTYNLIHHPKLLKDTITHAQEEYRKSQITSQAVEMAQAIAKSNANTNTQSVADELNKLFELYQKGAITQQEYIAQKNKLLGN